MPKLESKAIYRDLENGRAWPFYWLFGSESWKVRELLSQIRKAVLGEGAPVWNEMVLEGGEVTSEQVLDTALGTPLGGGILLVVVRNAHQLKNPEVLATLFGSSAPLSELQSVCVCLAKDLDGRKKFSKALVEKAAVVSCEEVLENQREGWIRFLAKRKDLNLDPSILGRLNSMDPWSLDLMERELEKWLLSGTSDEILGETFRRGEEEFLESFFTRQKKQALIHAAHLSQLDSSLPLLGLIGWNLRQLGLFLNNQKCGSGLPKLSPFLIDRLQRWSRYWTLGEVTKALQNLAEMDFKLKQTTVHLPALWSELVLLT